jgi:ketosteroid isomerase-like protein
MWTLRSSLVLAVIAAFFLGAGVDRTLNRRMSSSVTPAKEQTDSAGIERLHRLDERITLLSDPQALQAEWTNDAVRLNSAAPVDIGKAAIYATDKRSFADAPGFWLVSYKPDIRDVQIVGEWAFEWGLFSAGYRTSAGSPVAEVQGELLRVLHRESGGEWKFARVMISSNTH